MPTQVASAVYEVGGQGTLSGWQVISDNRGFVEDSEEYFDGSGKFASDITYSRRKTYSLELRALSGTTPATLVQGGTVTYDSVVCKIRSFSAAQTKGPITGTLELVSLTELIP